MIERHVTFQVYPDRAADFVAFFSNQYRPAMSTMPGFVKADLLREEGNSTCYQMSIRFETTEAATRWRNSEIHQSLQPALKALYRDSQLRVYTVVA